MNPILILEASKQPYISVGRLYGGIKYNGTEYTYIPPHDAFLDVKFIKEYAKQKKEGKTWEQFIEYLKTL